ncbi:MraZ protein [Weissella beninensis]|nr:MraZ protein [Periweissella beninensis]
MMFMGEYKHTVDAKGRLIIPAKFRNQLGNKFILIKWLEHSLYGFSPSAWEIFETKLKALPMTNKEARKFQRFVFSSAFEAEFDKQGRIAIPINLREYANLEKEIIVTGAGTGFEIWNATNWQTYTADVANDFDDIADGLVDFDF